MGIDPLSLTAFKIGLHGMVQRVGYRRFALESAQETGIMGYVQNERDGSVTIFAQGQEEAMNRFLAAIKKPPRGIIKEVERATAVPDPALTYFEIKFGSVQEELQEGFGAMESEFGGYREEFRDYRKEFGDHRQEFKDYREEFTDYREEFTDYREEFGSFAKRTDENFRLMSDRYGEISEKLTVILDTLIKESKETREMLNETMKALRTAVEKLSR